VYVYVCNSNKREENQNVNKTINA